MKKIFGIVMLGIFLISGCSREAEEETGQYKNVSVL